MRSQRLRKGRVLRDGRVLEQTLRGGRVVSSPYFRMYYLVGGGPPRVAFLAGRKVGGAVKRNRAKRLIREAYRKSREDLSNVTALVFIASARTPEAPLAEIEEGVRDALSRAADRSN